MFVSTYTQLRACRYSFLMLLDRNTQKIGNFQILMFNSIFLYMFWEVFTKYNLELSQTLLFSCFGNISRIIFCSHFSQGHFQKIVNSPTNHFISCSAFFFFIRYFFTTCLHLFVSLHFRRVVCLITDEQWLYRCSFRGQEGMDSDPGAQTAGRALTKRARSPATNRTTGNAEAQEDRAKMGRFEESDTNNNQMAVQPLVEVHFIYFPSYLTRSNRSFSWHRPAVLALLNICTWPFNLPPTTLCFPLIERGITRRTLYFLVPSDIVSVFMV